MLTKGAKLYIVNRRLIQMLFSYICSYFYNMYISDLNVFLSHMPYLNILIFLVKIPQIVKIFKNKSSEGINIFSVLLDLFAITATSSYGFSSNFPFR